jgi:hypothetical protein
MKSEVDQVTTEIFTEGARVYSSRTHVITRNSPDGVINAFSRVGIELVAETAFAGSLFLQFLPLAYDPTNDRTLSEVDECWVSTSPISCRSMELFREPLSRTCFWSTVARARDVLLL